VRPSLESRDVTSSVDTEVRETRKEDCSEKHTLAQLAARREQQEYAEDTEKA
jgi:hypothetical protein